ncbi:type I pullulanase, partial [Planococcus sp. SIMBA_160]
PESNDAIKKHMHRLAHGMVLTAQGLAFIDGGADVARTKGGNHNSYNAGDAVDAFDWQRKRDFFDTRRYFAGLIHLRREHPAFR